MKKLISLISTAIIGAGAGLSAVACGSETKYHDPNIDQHNNVTIAIPNGVGGDDKKNTWDLETMFKNQYTKDVGLFERQIEYNLAKAEWTNWAAKYIYDNDTKKGEAYFNALVGTLVSNSLVQDLFGKNYKENSIDETSIRGNGYTLADRADWHEYQTLVDKKYVDVQSTNENQPALKIYNDPTADPDPDVKKNKLTSGPNESVYKWKNQSFDAFEHINKQGASSSAVNFTSEKWANYWNASLVNNSGSGDGAQNILASIIQRYNEYSDYNGVRSIQPIDENGNSTTSGLYWDLSTYYNFKKMDMAETLLIMAWLNNINGFRPMDDNPNKLYFDFSSYLANRYIFSDGGQTDFNKLKTNTRMIWAQQFDNANINEITKPGETPSHSVPAADLLNNRQPSFSYNKNDVLGEDWYTDFNFNNNDGKDAIEITKDRHNYNFPVLDKRVSRQFDPIFHGFGYAGSFIGKSTSLNSKLALSNDDIKNTSIAGWLKNSAYTDDNRYYYKTSDYKKIDRGYVLPIWLIDVLIPEYNENTKFDETKTFTFVNPADTSSTSQTSSPIAVDSSSTRSQWEPQIANHWWSTTAFDNQGVSKLIWKNDPVTNMSPKAKQRILWWLEYELASNSSAFADTGEIKRLALKFMFKKYKVTVHEKTIYNAWKNYLDSNYNKKEDE